MKKGLLSILLIAYVVAVSGASIERHYCMGRFVDLSVYSSQQNKACGKCGLEEKKGGCCRDEQAYLKLNTDHQSVDNYKLSTFAEVELPSVFQFETQNFPVDTKGYLPVSKGPPLRYDSKLYILQRVYLI